MKRFISGAAAGFVSAIMLFSTAHGAADPVSPTDRASDQSNATRITFVARSWGAISVRWSIGATGEASLESRPRGVPLKDELQPTIFSVTPNDFVRLRSALAPAERLIGRDIPCSREFTDGPYGEVIWMRPDGREDRISWSGGCARNADWDLLFDRIGEAEDIFHKVTNTQ